MSASQASKGPCTLPCACMRLAKVSARKTARGFCPDVCVRLVLLYVCNLANESEVGMPHRQALLLRCVRLHRVAANLCASKCICESLRSHAHNARSRCATQRARLHTRDEAPGGQKPGRCQQEVVWLLHASGAWCLVVVVGAFGADLWI